MNVTDKVVNKAIDYIIENLNWEINVEDVASYCNFSKYYFSRVFKAEVGEGIYSFIKRLRLERSAIKLGSDTGRSITDIGLDYGYSSSNYSSAFKKQHNLSPAKFRDLRKPLELEHPFYNFTVEYGDFDFYDRKIEVKELCDFTVLFKRYIGNYKTMADNWQDFFSTYSNLITAETLFIEVTYDDPVITDLDRCIYDICMTVNSQSDHDNIKLINGGKFAVYSFSGGVEEIFQAYKGIFNIWLPASKYVLDDRVGFDIYRKADCENNYFEMDICIPLK